jgi:predicted RNA polymerase sigma factor
LDLLFMCCHPALSPSSAIALTLRAVGGLTTAEIAKAFLVPEATLAQRISRAKQTIKASGVPFAMPAAAELATRLSHVMHVLYLIFSEGYTASSGRELLRSDLANEALRLTRMLHRLVPDDPEVSGLLSLMLLTDARRNARTGPAGELIPLDEQDRTLWDRAAIAEGVALISATLSCGAIGAYQLQAAIAAVHDEAASAAETDWVEILGLYGLLLRLSRSTMRSHWPWYTAPLRDSNDSTRLRLTRAWNVITGSMPCARICWSARAIDRTRSASSNVPPSARPATQNATTF